MFFSLTAPTFRGPDETRNITRPTHEPRTDRGERCSDATPLGPAHLTPRVFMDPETLDEWVSFVVS